MRKAGCAAVAQELGEPLDDRFGGPNGARSAVESRALQRAPEHRGHGRVGALPRRLGQGCGVRKILRFQLGQKCFGLGPFGGPGGSVAR
jgi:hypothetical protein